MTTRRIKSVTIMLEDGTFLQAVNPANGFYRTGRNSRGKGRDQKLWMDCEVRWTEPIPEEEP